MKNSIFLKIFNTLIVMLAIYAVNLGVIYIYQNLSVRDNEIINISGSQRMLSQKMARLALSVERGNDDDRNKLKEVAGIYGSRLKIVEFGGRMQRRPFLRGKSHEKHTSSFPPSPSSMRALFAKNKALWFSIEKQINVVTTSERKSAEFHEAVNFIISNVDSLEKASDDITNGFETHFKKKNGIFKLILLALFLLDCLAFFIVTTYIQRNMSPLRELAKTIDKIRENGLPQRLDFDFSSTNDEVGILSKSFIEMVKAIGETTIAKDFFNAILQNMNDALIVIGDDGNIEIVNKSAKHLLGRGEELTGMPIDVIFGDDPFIHETLNELFNKGFVANIETSFFAMPGRKIPVLLSAALMKTARSSRKNRSNPWNDHDELVNNKEKTRIVMVATDVTRLKSDADALRKSARMNELILDSLPHAAMLVEKKSRKILAQNKAAVETGLRIGDYCWQGFGCLEFIPEEDRMYFEKQKTPPAGGIRCSFCRAEEALEKKREINSSGVRISDRVLDIHWLPIDDDSYLHYVVDITEYKKGEEELKGHSKELEIMVAERTSALERTSEKLKEREFSLARAQQLARFGCWEMNIVTQEMRWSDEMYRIFGLQPREFDASYDAFLNFVHTEDREGVKNTIEKSITEKGHYKIDHRILPVTGETKYVHGEGEMVISGGEAPVQMMGTIQDVTSTWKNNEERKMLERQLFQSQKMDAIGQLAGGVAHDFNNMLAVIMGNCEFAISELSGDNTGCKELKTILKASERAKELVMKLLTFARKDKLNVRACSINEIVKNVIGMLERSISKKIKIRTHPGENLPAVNIDAGQVEQALLNMCANARDAMPGGGTLTIETGMGGLHDGFSENEAAAKPESCVFVRISDTGVGMSEETVNKIFDPFFTTKDIGKGTGLGLSVSHGIIKRHDGHINVRSELGKGTTMEIYLPANEYLEIIKAGDEPTKIKRGAETILVVDDESMLLEITQRMLATAGYRTLTANSGKDAVNLYKKSHGEIDIVVLDLIMPEMDGADVFRELKQINPEIKIVLSSGFSINGQASGLISEGACGFVQKPFNFAELCNSIRKALDE